MENQHTDIRFLADLTVGQSAVISTIRGYGAFRRRIIEMGFVAGTTVKVIKRAPLPFGDPIEYELMGYRVSLRKSEAMMIEVVPSSEFKIQNSHHEIHNSPAAHLHFSEKNISRTAAHWKRLNSTSIQVALVGNPNSGKTSLFNYTTGKTERVGNYGGVTVDVKTAHFHKDNYRIDLTDLPGTYSISEYSPEELFVRQHLTETPPDVVINVVDASNLERNLYLTTQLIEMNVKVVVALNMYDELEQRGEKIDYKHLGQLLGFPIIPTVAAKGKGIDELIKKVIEVYQGKCDDFRHIHINYGDQTSETAIVDTRYAFIRGALKETYKPSQEKTAKGYELDKVFTNKWLGIPVFLLIMLAMFQITFILGNYPMRWIEQGVEWLNSWVQSIIQEGILRDMLTEGMIAGVGGVIVFLPNIIILFLCISLMEDTGYMARAAFIMDKLMHKIGLHGKSFIPMLMGFGCNVPAIMATRTLDNRKDRLVTMLIVPFMSCSARLPIYILLISVFFAQYQGLVMFSIYIVGVAIAAVMAILFNKIVFKKRDIPFVMELPPYRLPTLRNTATHTWAKSVQYLQKMGTVILVASLIIWALGYFPHNKQLKDKNPQLALEQSYIGRLGHVIEPAIRPLGYDWKIGVSILTGMGAKEIVVSSMGVLYQAEPDADENSETLKTKLQTQTFSSGTKAGQKVFTPIVAYSFMIFILLYFPCIAALAAIRREAGWHWAAFTALFNTAMAWIAAFLVVKVGAFFL